MTLVNWKKVKNSKAVRHNIQSPCDAQRNVFPRRFVGIQNRVLLVGVCSLIFAGGLWFRFGTIQGVPTQIVFKFLTDQTAREAYFSGRSSDLHARLQDLSVEEEIKAYYRSQFSDEVELDWFIHQLLYERTGYVGKSYKIGSGDRLTLVTQKDRAFPRWFALATKANVVRGTREDQGVIYVTLSNGSEVTYEAMSEIYKFKILRQLIHQQKQ